VTPKGGIPMESKKINPIAEQSKEMIISALLKLLEEKHYTQITISDIADKAQLARRTFYRNFNSKEDVIKEYYDKQSEKLMEVLKKEETLSVYIVARTYFTFMKRNLDVLRLLEKNDLLYLILQFSQPLIYQTFEMDNITNDKSYYTNYLFAFTSGAFWNVLIVWLREGAVKTPDEIAALINDVLNKELFDFN